MVGLLAAAAGVTIAILAFGWKDVPGQKLYTPHKWAGVGVMGMALVQVRALSPHTCGAAVSRMFLLILCCLRTRPLAAVDASVSSQQHHAAGCLVVTSTWPRQGYIE